jgi:hypothetical protein
MKKNKTLQALFSFPGFKAMKHLQGKFGDHRARIVKLRRQKKQQNALDAANITEAFMIAKCAKHETWMLQTIDSMCAMKGGACLAQSVVYA